MKEQPATSRPADAPGRAARGRTGPPPCPAPAACAHAYHCPTCGAGSCHPDDAAYGHCGACGFQTPAPREARA